MATSMHGCIQETEQAGAPPTTHNFDPALCELEIIRTTCSRLAPFGVERRGPLPGTNAPSFGLQLAAKNTVTSALIRSVNYVVGIRNKKTDELWKCAIAADGSSTCLLVNGGMYKIEAHIFPPGLVTSSNVDLDGKPLRQHEGMLNILVQMELGYRCDMFLTNNREDPDVLSYVMTEVTAAPVADYLQGALLTVEFPLARIQVTGIETSIAGRKVIHHFQDLVNNGLYEQFTRDQLSLKEFVDTHYKCQDLIPRIILEGSVMALVQSKWDECEEKACKAIAKAGQLQSTNINILRAVMKYRVGTVRRLNGDLRGAWECMDEANELLQFVGPCEAVAEFYHHLFSLYADDRTSASGANHACAGASEAAEHYYHMAVDNWRRYCESFPDVTTQLDFEVRAAVRLINYFLQTTRDRAPSMVGRVSAVDLAKAEEVILHIEQQPLSVCQRRVLAGYYLAKTDFLLLREAYVQGITAVKKSLRISKALGLKKYIKGGEERLELLRQKSGQDGEEDQQDAVVYSRQPSQGVHFDDLLEELHIQSPYQRQSSDEESNPP